MKSFGAPVTTDSHDNTASLVPRAVDALLGLVALVALVVAFAVEFAPSLRMSNEPPTTSCMSARPQIRPSDSWPRRPS